MSVSSSFVIILTTFPADGDPVALAQTLVEERLVACVNVLPAMQSIYRWEEKVEHAAERQLLMKTTGSQVEAVKARLADLHPYDVPEVLVVPIVDGGEPYLQWVSESVRLD